VVHEIVVSRRALQVALAAFVVVLLVLAVAAPRAVQMLVAGAAIALLLSTPLGWLRRVLPRRAALPVLLASVLVAVALALYFVIPLLALQVGRLIADLPALVEAANARLAEMLDALARRGLATSSTEATIRALQQESLTRIGGMIGGLASRGVSSLQAIATLFVSVLGALFIAVYLLVDAPRLREALVRHAPDGYAEDAGALWDQAGTQLSRYLASLVVVAAVQTVVSSTILWALGVPYAIVLGTWIGATSTIPYIGTWFGGIPAIGLASLQSPLTGAAFFGLFFLSTTVIGNVITPRLQGAAVRVHPVLVLLSVIAAGEVFGIVGLFLAVPALAVGRVLLDFLRQRVRVRT
jgi:predicted PurR-regulated permease PerM